MIDYTKEDFTQVVAAYDVIVDCVGNAPFRHLQPLIKPGGERCCRLSRILPGFSPREAAPAGPVSTSPQATSRSSLLILPTSHSWQRLAYSARSSTAPLTSATSSRHTGTSTLAGKGQRRGAGRALVHL